MPLRTGYLYDADGARVAKGTITTMSCDPTANGFQITENYVLGPSGEELSMVDGTNTWQRTNVYVGGRLTATYDLAGLHFHLSDPLGTRRVQLSGNLTSGNLTSSNLTSSGQPQPLGQAELDCQSLPYGDQQSCTPAPNAPSTSDDATPLHFTGKERDPESGNDYFGARYYASTMGRFMSPDWSAKEEPVPYATMNDPQSLNLYAYVRNNPLRSVDPDGHEYLITAPTEEDNSQSETESSQSVADQQQAQQGAQQQGSGTAGTIYNETSTLRENGKTVGPDLHNARVAIAQVIDVNRSTAKVASSIVQDNLKYPPAGAAMKDSQAAVSEVATAPNGTQGATHFFLAGGNTPTPAWVSQGKVVESFGPFPVVANTHDFSKGQSATIQIIQYPVPKQ